MNNKFLKISLIVIILAIVVIGSYFLIGKEIKKQPKSSAPAEIGQLNKLPYITNDYRLTYNSGANAITIVPKIPDGIDEPPSYYIQKYWTTYVANANEALQWLEDNGLGKDFRTKYGINIEWWGQEWWSAGASIKIN